jgi:ribosomal-protein-alanine N-acetyltransferase
MTLDDIPEVMLIERASFPTPWSEELFRTDISENLNSQYIVGIIDGRIATYAGIWVLNEVGHITTIAVRDDLRRRGLGDTTLIELFKIARAAGVLKFTLEVRASNKPAIKMYEKHGFKHVGLRKNYYKEISEDAVVMWSGEPPYEG